MILQKLTHTLEIPDLPVVVKMDQGHRVAVLKKIKVPKGDDVTVEFSALLIALQKLGIRNVDEAGLAEALPDVLEDTPFCFAQATPPQHGQNGHIDYSFENNMAKKVWEDDSPKVDFHERNEINNVSKGDLLAELKPMVLGVDGVNVLGQPIKARPARPGHLFGGKNVSLSDDGTKAYSEIDGMVKEVKAHVSVAPVLIIEGDVNFKSGSIKFIGDVIVKGNVNETFAIEAGGCIQVEKSVDHAHLKAGGNILIHTGIFGKEDTTVEAAGDISFGFAENANIKAGGNVYARTGVINCNVSAGEKIYLKGSGKILVGGHIIANHGVEGHSLGNPHIATRSIIEFGVRLELIEKVRALHTKLSQTENAEEKKNLREEMRPMLEEYALQLQAKVVATDTIYPGVLLIYNQIKYEVPRVITHMIFYKQKAKNEISMRPYLNDEGNKKNKGKAK